MFVCALCTCIGLHLVAHAPYAFGTSLGDFMTCSPGCGSLTVSSGCRGQCKNAAQCSKDPEKTIRKWFGFECYSSLIVSLVSGVFFVMRLLCTVLGKSTRKHNKHTDHEQADPAKCQDTSGSLCG